MFDNAETFAAHSTQGILEAAEAAARAVPPAFPLDATVAVNPFLGQAGEPFAAAATRLARVAGMSLTPPRADLAAALTEGRVTNEDLEAALAASPSPLKPASLAALKARMAEPAPEATALPTIADLAAKATGADWPAIIARCFGLWAAGRFDRGQALWSPAPELSAWASWRAWASSDLTPEIAGLAGFCAHVAASPDNSARAILRAADALGLSAPAAETAFHRLLLDLGGWPQHARWLLWRAEMEGVTDGTLVDLLAIRLTFEEALLAHAPGVATDWAEIVALHAAPVEPGADEALDAILLEAAERGWQRRLAASLGAAPAPAAERPAIQAVFCIDVRSEVFRRALEAEDAGIVTKGFAGFFGLPAAHRPHGSDEAEAHLPVLLNPAMTATGHAAPAAEEAERIAARAKRAWGRFRQAAVSSFAFVEAAGPAYAWKLAKDGLSLASATAPSPAPRFDPPLSPAQKAETGAAALKAMGLASGHARLVLLMGHGAHAANNPHESAYQCGACGGRTGEVSARLLAALLNDPETRAGLGAHGVSLPEDAHFLAGLHDTTTDEATLFEDAPAPGHAEEISRARAALKAAGAATRAERALRIPGAKAESLAARALNWAELRPEWGLAGCAAFIAAPRAASAGADLGGRAFLHCYDWKGDEGFGTLELILTAPVVVASWISLQYYGSAVAPAIFGSGDKLIHNVVGGFGVVEGNGGALRAGLPLQAVHDGERPVHEPLRLSVLIEAPREAVADILSRHPGVRALFDNCWMHLLLMEGGRVSARYRPGLQWEAFAAEPRRAAA